MSCSNSPPAGVPPQANPPSGGESIYPRHLLYIPDEPLTEAALCDWIAQALVGEAIQYHEGFLLLDRSAQLSPFPTKERNRIHAVARRAWIACELGLVHLFSRSVGPSHYRYLAVRARTPLLPAQINLRLRAARPASPPKDAH